MTERTPVKPHCPWCSARFHGRVLLGDGICDLCLKIGHNKPGDEVTVMVEGAVHESRDGTGAGDHDSVFQFGNPREYLTVRSQARLTILRGLVMDTRRAAREGVADGGAADGDIDVGVLVGRTESGLYLAK